MEPSHALLDPEILLMRHAFLILPTLLLLLAAAPSKTRMPKPELAGIKLGMEADAARGQLAKHGTAAASKEQEHEGGEQQSWAMKKGPWGYVALGFQGERVHWITAFARQEGPRIRYRDVGPVDLAQRTGTYFFIWRVPAHGDVAPYTVIARGTDSVYVSSVSVTGGATAVDRPGAPHDSQE
jgi:hypothetical protein